MTYTSSNIEVLEGLDPVRKRPGMYIGSTDERGLHHLVYEIVDNAIDEALAGYCTSIEVRLLPDNGVQVTDDGRGIPVDIHTKTGKSALETVMTVLHAGGKFGGEDSGYKVSGGLHGVGASVVNALSTRLQATVCRDGKQYTQHYARGVPQAPVAHVGPATTRGTTIAFWADDTIFKNTTYDYDTLLTRLRQQAYLTRGIQITLIDDRVPEENGTGRSYRFYFE